MTLKTLAKDLLPPIVTKAIRRLRKIVPEYEYMPMGWQTPVRGYDHPSASAVHRAGYDALVTDIQREDYFSRTETSLFHHNLVMTFAHALNVALGDSKCLSILDFGGGLGAYRLIARRLRPDIEIDYHCAELPLMAAEGQGLHEGAHFYSDLTWALRTYDFVFSSGALHYTKDWQETLRMLSQATEIGGYLYITRHYITDNPRSFVIVQRPYQHGYQTEYLSWCLSRAEFLGEVEKNGLRLMGEFSAGDIVPAQNAPGSVRPLGFLFQKQT